MSDLVAFLRARLDDDERVVRVDPGYSQEWHTEVARDDPYDESRACVRSSQGDVITNDVDVERADHIAHYDPVRMLREVEAKRRILDEHASDDGDCSACGRASWEENPGAYLRDEPEMADVWRPAIWPCRTARLLALPYADHDDYEEDWRP